MDEWDPLEGGPAKKKIFLSMIHALDVYYGAMYKNNIFHAVTLKEERYIIEHSQSAHLTVYRFVFSCGACI